MSIEHDVGTNKVMNGADIHSSVSFGHFNVIGRANIGADVEVGNHCVIDDGVVIGRGTRIMSHVELRRGVVIGEDCYIDSGVTCTGSACIGDRVTLRNNVVIARGCNIGDDCFICPQVMFNNLNHLKVAVGGAHVGNDVFIGTQSVIGAGLKVAALSIVGACSMVTKDIKSAGVYLGVPAKRVK